MFNHAEHDVDGFLEVLFHEAFPHTFVIGMMNGVPDAGGKSELISSIFAFIVLSAPNTGSVVLIHFIKREPQQFVCGFNSRGTRTVLQIAV